MLISRNLFRLCLTCSLAALASVAAIAQSTTNDAQPPVAYASANEVNNILAQIRQTAQNIDADLGKTRIEKFVAAKDPKIDCFFVYPTVSLDPGWQSDFVPDRMEWDLRFAEPAPMPHPPQRRRAAI